MLNNLINNPALRVLPAGTASWAGLAWQWGSCHSGEPRLWRCVCWTELKPERESDINRSDDCRRIYCVKINSWRIKGRPDREKACAWLRGSWWRRRESGGNEQRRLVSGGWVWSDYHPTPSGSIRHRLPASSSGWISAITKDHG